MTVATAIYRSIMVEVERRRLQLGWPMWKLDDAAGTNDGHYSHCLWPDGASGRQCQWDTLDLFFEAMFPDGYELVLRPTKTGHMDAPKQRFKIRSAAAYTNVRTMREHMRDLGKKGGKKGGDQRAKKLGKRARRRIAKAAARARWDAINERAKQITADIEAKTNQGEHQ